MPEGNGSTKNVAQSNTVRACSRCGSENWVFQKGGETSGQIVCKDCGLRGALIQFGQDEQVKLKKDFKERKAKVFKEFQTKRKTILLERLVSLIAILALIFLLIVVAMLTLFGK